MAQGNLIIVDRVVIAQICSVLDLAHITRQSILAILFEKGLKVMQIATFIRDLILCALLPRVLRNSIAPTARLNCGVLSRGGGAGLFAVLIESNLSDRVASEAGLFLPITARVIDDRLQRRILIKEPLRVEFGDVEVLGADLTDHLLLGLVC